MQGRSLARRLTVAGAASIVGSILLRAIQGGQGKTAEKPAHSERFSTVALHDENVA